MPICGMAGIFQPDEKVIEAFRQIADFSNLRHQDEHWIRHFLDGADPLIIAHAKAHELIVVTMEGNKGSEEINPKSKRFIGKLKDSKYVQAFWGKVHFRIRVNTCLENRTWLITNVSAIKHNRDWIVKAGFHWVLTVQTE